ADIIQRSPGLVDPDQFACAVILCDEDVKVAPDLREQSHLIGAAESRQALEITRHITVARRVHGDAPASIQAGAAGLFGPKQVARSVVFGAEDFCDATILRHYGAIR